METNEKILFHNSLGSVTDKRIIINYKDGAEDVPLGQITSVSYRHTRNYFFAIGGFILSIVALTVKVSKINLLDGAGMLILVIVLVISLLSGIANWIGHHNIVISVGRKDRKALKAEMSKTSDGREFSHAVKRAFIK